MTKQTKAIIELNNFIILDEYVSKWQRQTDYQSEADLENELIDDLINQGYEFLPDLTNLQAMYANVKLQLESLNNIKFSSNEWQRFVESFLDKANDNIVDKARKIHDNYIYDFVFDDDKIFNIYLFDKKNFLRNKLQVIRQFEQEGKHLNRYDVTILVNGLPLLHIELKKRGVEIREAFNQVHRYSKESFNSQNSLYKYLQIFVISNGTDTRYFANTTNRDKNSFDFTMNWARFDNSLIKDLKDFTATFFEKNTLLNVLLNYSVLDVNNNLLVMRPYQIAATERILRKIKSSHQAKNWSNVESGGYIWHTTGSGKTLTSFKVARLATEIDFIDKVLFVVDRKDLDFQTMREYQRFSKDSVNGSSNTEGLRRNLENDDNKIIVTTIQKLNNLLKSDEVLSVYGKQVVFIFDECHRSQFGKSHSGNEGMGKAQENIRKKFKKFYQFGFTGTPILEKNALGSLTTQSIFGQRLHAYVITDAIRDEKVLKFKVDYNAVRPKFKSIENEQDFEKLSALEHEELLLHPQRILEISQYILKNYRYKTHRLKNQQNGFNAMFAVSSVLSAKLYYEALNQLQKDSEKPLKIATIFSFASNEEQDAVGEIVDETFDVSAMNSSAKEFLSMAINDYNQFFKTNYSVDSKEFENYYRDLAKRVKSREVDLVIVVGMFLTGFDAPTLNTLFVDKNLRYHGLLQAYSRTNRIYDSTKTFGNIVTFRNLEQATIDAIKLFGNSDVCSVVLEKSYKEYMEGFKDIISGEMRRGFIEVSRELTQRFLDPQKIEKEVDKKAFVNLFSEYLRLENILQNFDEFSCLKALQNVDIKDLKAVEEFKINHQLSDEDFVKINVVKLINDRQIQDYRSTYNDIRQWLQNERISQQKNDSKVDWDDVVFEVDLLKSQEINVDYILEQIFENNKKINNKNILINEVQRLIRSSLNNRAKESLLIDFINQINFDEIADKASLIEAYHIFAEAKKNQELEELIAEENLNPELAKRYIATSIKRKLASDNGAELNSILPKMSPLNPEFLVKKQNVFAKIFAFVEKYKIN